MAVNREKIQRAAEKLVQKGKIEQAIGEYEKLLKANPNDANTINRIGDLYGRVGQVDKAIELYEKIADNFTEDGFATKAIAILKKINRLAPQRLDIFSKLADLYMQQGLLVEAQNQYQILADWYAKNDDVAHAIGIHKKLVQIDPNNHMAHLRLADLLMQTGETDDAIAVYDRLGSLLLEREKFDEAERLYRHALDASPPRGDFLAPLCSALLDAGRSGVAREFLSEALRLSPQDYPLRVLDVRISLSSGSAEAAKQKADAILAEHPEDTTLRALVGRAMISAGQAGEARELMIPAIEALLAKGDHAGAQQMAEHLIKAMPQDRRVLELGVRAYAPGGDTEMVFTLKAALADSLFRGSDQRAARQAYQSLLEQDPGNKLFRQRIAQLDSGDMDMEPRADAVAAPAPAEQAVPDGGAAAANAALPKASVAATFNPKERLAEANVFAKYGLVEKALGHLRQIVDSFPEESEARERLVLLLIEKGESDEALSLASPLMDHYRRVGDDSARRILIEALPQLAVPAQAAAPPVELELPAEIDEDEEVIVLEIDEDDFAEVDLAAAPPAEPAPEPAPEPFAEPTPALPLEPTPPADEAISFEMPTESEDSAEAEIQFEFMEESDGASPYGAESELPDAAEEGLAQAADAVEEPFEEPPPVAPAEPGREPEMAAEKPQASRVRASSVLSAAMSELDAIERAVRSEPAGRKAPAPSAAAAPQQVPPAPQAEPEREEMVEISGALAGPSVSDLEQTDFFIQQELYEDAIRTLGQLEADYPNDPEVAERRLLLKNKGMLLDEVSALKEDPEELFADEEDFFDLAKELEDELAEEEAMVEEATGRSKDEAQLEEVFREFQKGVAEQLSEEDSDTHFNLGIAYKEMGLLPEAIREFQVAARDEKMFVECCSMIGVCYVEQGMAGQAAEWYSKALTAPDLIRESRRALSYDLAAALEMAGDVGQALELFQDIAGESPGFRDVSQRVMALSGA